MTIIYITVSTDRDDQMKINAPSSLEKYPKSHFVQGELLSSIMPKKSMIRIPSESTYQEVTSSVLVEVNSITVLTVMTRNPTS